MSAIASGTEAGSDRANLIRLVYVSDAVASLAAGDLDAIRASSEARNLVSGLTGLLLFRRPIFCGILEGPRRRLFARMEVIATDPRHARLRVLREQAIDERRFSNWTLGILPEAMAGPGGAERPEVLLATFADRLG